MRALGTQKSRLGSDVESRFWISYRPYESKDGAREWFIGPVLTWLHSQDDRIAAVTQSGSGGDVLLAGITTYVGVRPGMHVWLGMAGMLRIRPAPCSSLSAVTSVSELLVSFGCTSNERRNDEHKKTRVAIFARLRVCAGFARTDQAHRNARRRHDVKLLSLRGEATPRTPVWRSKSGC